LGFYNGVAGGSVASSSMVKKIQENFEQVDPRRWGHYVELHCQKLITQWRGVVSKKTGIGNCHKICELHWWQGRWEGNEGTFQILEIPLWKFHDFCYYAVVQYLFYIQVHAKIWL